MFIIRNLIRDMFVRIWFRPDLLKYFNFPLGPEIFRFATAAWIPWISEDLKCIMHRTKHVWASLK